MRLEAGRPLRDALADVARQAGVGVDVQWGLFDGEDGIDPAAPVGAVALDGVSPLTAVRAVVESAGGRGFSAAVSHDGDSIVLAPGTKFPIGGDGRLMERGRYR